MSLTVVILAAGKGTRMKSATPKVLHKLAGKPLLGHVIDTARTLNADRICVVYGHGGELLPKAFEADNDLHWVLQEPQLGTGHAVQQTTNIIADSDKVLILYGDVPLTPASILGELVTATTEKSMALLTAMLSDPGGYGRIVRDNNGKACAIVEQKDANEEQLLINEINTGIMSLPTSRLLDWLQRIDSNNAQGEYYLTDVIALAVEDNIEVFTIRASNLEQVSGINSRLQLVELERYHQESIAEELCANGVTIRDPFRFDLRGTVSTGQDIEIDVNVVLEGNVEIGNNVVIEPNCIIRNSKIGDNVSIRANSLIEDSTVDSGCTIGPYARLRPDTKLGKNARVGNFVEIKKSIIGEGSKINHLSYIGDTEMGSNVNVGAGTITCNYDGVNKHKTVIEDNVFIGSDSQLVAPVSIGKNATIGAGSTITKTVPADNLTLSRSRQITVDKWERPVKKK